MIAESRHIYTEILNVAELKALHPTPWSPDADRTRLAQASTQGILPLLQLMRRGSMEPVNLKRLAKELNLSVSTVSRALQDSYEISQATKKQGFCSRQETQLSAESICQQFAKAKKQNDSGRYT